MTQVPTALQSLAEDILLHEAGGRVDPQGLADAAGRTARTLCRSLGHLVGAAGCQALIARALHLAQADHTFLRAVTAEVGPGGPLAGLRRSVESIDPPEARDGLRDVFAQFLGLLHTFIGEGLTLRLVGDAWPAITPRASARGTEEPT